MDKQSLSLDERPLTRSKPSLPSEPSSPLNEARAQEERVVTPESTATASPPPDDQNQPTQTQDQSQTAPIQVVVSDQDELPTPVIEQEDKRQLPVTPVGELAKTINTLKKEKAFEEEEEAVDRAREIEHN